MRPEVDFSLVVPAKAGTQVLFSPHHNLDARFRGHDGTSLRLKTRDFNHARARLEMKKLQAGSISRRGPGSGWVGPLEKSLTIAPLLNRIASTMIRHLFGALLCIFLLGAITADAYSSALKTDLSSTLSFETSFVALDPPDDLGDTPFPEGINSTPRGRVIAKLTLGPSIYKMRFVSSPQRLFERGTFSPLTSQYLFHFEQVYRI